MVSIDYNWTVFVSLLIKALIWSIFNVPNAYEQTRKAVSWAKLCADILWLFNFKVAYDYDIHLKIYVDFDNGISIKLRILQDANCATMISFSVDFERQIISWCQNSSQTEWKYTINATVE